MIRARTKEHALTKKVLNLCYNKTTEGGGNHVLLSYLSTLSKSPKHEVSKVRDFHGLAISILCDLAENVPWLKYLHKTLTQFRDPGVARLVLWSL